MALNVVQLRESRCATIRCRRRSACRCPTQLARLHRIPPPRRQGRGHRVLSCHATPRSHPVPERPNLARGSMYRCAHAAASTDAPPNTAPVTTASVVCLRAAHRTARAALARGPVRPRWLRADARRRNPAAERRHPLVLQARAGKVAAAPCRDLRRRSRPGTARPAPWPEHALHQFQFGRMPRRHRRPA